MLSIDQNRTDLCEEFKRKPYGHHSADLHRLLDLMRTGYVRGKTLIICTVPHKEWHLGKLGPRRGAKVEIDRSRTFNDHDEAVWACFRARWKEMTGRDCPVT